MQHTKRRFISMTLVVASILPILSSCGKPQGASSAPVDATSSSAVTSVQPDIEKTGFDWSAVGDIAAVAAGDGYSLLLSAENKLYSWGGNWYGTLGRYGADSPEPEVILTDVTHMSAGLTHAGAIKSDHTLWLWGSNDGNQLGDTGEAKAAEPVMVMQEVKDVVCADGFTVVLYRDGTVVTFGRCDAGQLGGGSAENSAGPVEALDGVTKIAAGKAFVLALKSDGSLWGWGAGLYGQLLGNTDGSMSDAGQPVPIQSVPIKLTENIKGIACGAAHALVLDHDGNLYAWGLNSSGQLGNDGQGTWVDVNYGGRALYSDEQNLVMTDVTYIAAGGDTSAAVKSDGSLWMWGANGNYQLGDGTSYASSVPVHVLDDVLSVSVSFSHVMALTTDHSYYAWGSNSNNILGDGNPTELYEPVKIMDNVTSAALYSEHTLVVTENNELYAFGDNSMGQLNTGDFQNTSVPTLIMTDVSGAAAGAQHTLCLKTDGSVWAWGGNALGQIGSGKTEEVYSMLDVWRDGHPVWADASGNETDTVGPAVYKPIQILVSATGVFAKWHTSYALLTDGTLTGWGWNELYQLGDDTRQSRAAPQLMMEQVKTLIPSYALIKNDNSLWTWGSNAADPYNLLPVRALDRVISAAVQDRTFLAVRDDHTLWIWGGSVDGALIGSEEYFSTAAEPVQIGSGVKKVFANDQNIFVIDTADTLWALDSNDIFVKALNKATSDVFTYAEEYKVMENAAEVYIGLESVLVLKKDASLWGFGSNESGQLGGGQRFFTPRHIN